MKKTILIILVIITNYLCADFLIPTSDPVYEFFEITHTSNVSQTRLLQYPLYYSDIINELLLISEKDTSYLYQRHAIYHLKRLKMDYQEGPNIAFWPFKQVEKNIKELFQKNTQTKKLISYKNTIIESNSPAYTDPTLHSYKNEVSLYISGILGTEYSVKESKEESVYRFRRYYGFESAGNLANDLGYYISFRKGHYIGNTSFILEDPFITQMDGKPYHDGSRYYRVDLVSEVDFKNSFLNISSGFGGFDIGRTITTSVIMNNNVTSMAYVKFNKRIGLFDYNSITTQLIPDRIHDDYRTKSLGIQTITLSTNYLDIGFGNTIVYGDRSIDLGYASPVSLYLLMDNKYHGKDNYLIYCFNEIRLTDNFSIFNNILLDDIKKDRLFNSKGMSYIALQGGILTSKYPFEFGGEVTAVGPSTYSHKNNLTYMHDSMPLGSLHGSNFLSFAGRVRYYYPNFSFGIIYENIQQGDLARHPNDDIGEQKFLKDNIERREYVKSNFDIRLIPELHLFVKYKHNVLSKKSFDYIFTGLEFKY